MDTLIPTKDLLKQLQDAGVAYEENKNGARERLMSLCYTLIASLESPGESLQRMGWAEPARNADCRVAVDLKLFELMREDEEIGVQGVTVKELAGKAGADEVLISRMMKHLAAMNVVGESGPDTYVLLPLSRSMTEPRYKSGITFNQDIIAPLFFHLPRYLRDTQHGDPSPPNGPFQTVFNTHLSIAAYCTTQWPQYLGMGWSYMLDAWQAGYALPDPEFCPLLKRLVERFDLSKGEGALLVAMGNARGNDGFLRKVRELFHGHRGRLILQATEEVFIQVLLSGYVGIFQTMPHDISDPQPVQKARAYYLRTALRDKSEQECVNILEQLKPAIEPGYSVVLLNEVIVSSQHAPWRVTSMDRVTGVTFAKKERTEEEMARIIEKAGFKIRKTHRYPMACSILIEIILDSEPLIEDGSEDDGAMETAIDPDPGVDADVDMEDCIVVATD